MSRIFKSWPKAWKQITNEQFWKSIPFAFKGICFSYLMGFLYAPIFREDVTVFIYWFFGAAIWCMKKREIDFKNG